MSILSEILGAVAPIASAIPGPWQPYAMGYTALDAANTGNKQQGQANQAVGQQTQGYNALMGLGGQLQGQYSEYMPLVLQALQQYMQQGYTDADKAQMGMAESDVNKYMKNLLPSMAMNYGLSGMGDSTFKNSGILQGLNEGGLAALARARVGQVGQIADRRMNAAGMLGGMVGSTAGQAGSMYGAAAGGMGNVGQFYQGQAGQTGNTLAQLAQAWAQGKYKPGMPPAVTTTADPGLAKWNFPKDNIWPEVSPWG